MNRLSLHEIVNPDLLLMRLLFRADKNTEAWIAAQAYLRLERNAE